MRAVGSLTLTALVPSGLMGVGGVFLGMSLLSESNDLFWVAVLFFTLSLLIVWGVAYFEFRRDDEKL